MRSVLTGGFALIVLYWAVQPNTAKAAASGGNIAVAGLRRLLSAQVAGIPDRSGTRTKTSSTSTGSSRTTNV